MSRVWKLLKLQLDNRYSLFKRQKFKTFFVGVAKYLFIMAAITTVLSLILSKIIFYLSIQVNEQVIAIVLAFTQVLTFGFAVVSIIKNLYLSKDNELLIILPVTFNQLFISKIIILYISELVFSVLYIVPIFLSIGLISQMGIVYYLMILISLPILPIFPLVIGSLISIPIMFVVKWLKSHTVTSIIIILTVVVTAFVLYMMFVMKISGAFNIAEKQIETSLQINSWIANNGKIFGYYFLAKCWFLFGSVYRLFIFLAISLALLAVCMLLIKPFFFKIATITNENTSTQHYTPKRFKKRSQLAEMFVNETKSVFRSPSYIFQYFLFPLFMPVIVFTYDKLLTTISVNQAGRSMIIGSHILVLCIVALMSNIISSSAISREGANFYLAKTTPVNFYKQVLAKCLFNALFTLTALLVTCITTLILSDIPPVFVIFSTISIMILSIGHICHSFDMDLQKPLLDWYDNSEISKISHSTTKSIVYALLWSVIMCILTISCLKSGMLITLIIMFIVSLAYCLSRIYLLYLRTEYYYNKMEM